GSIQWMESVARSGITPHLPGLLINEVEYEGRRLIAAAVPQGYDPPYEVASAGARFFVRDERSVRTMSREEIKFAASRSADLTQRIDAFVAERTQELTDNAFAGEDATPLQGALLLITPIFDGTFSYRIDLQTVMNLVPHMTSFEGKMVASGRPRIDGLLYEFQDTSAENSKHLRGHGFLFRHGAVEVVDGYVCGRREALPGLLLMNGLIESVRRSVELCRTVTGADTFAIDFRMVVSAAQKIAFFNDRDRGHHPTDRARLYFDRQVITQEQFSSENLAALIRPLLDQIWQAFGYVNCGYFKDDGTYLPPR
ncbi:MAG: hypothetical protein KKA45_12520, partial [Alphaproteobacteria bacterium]|nr:hypothetical protein [Alphaproteobacteria bacterium]